MEITVPDPTFTIRLCVLINRRKQQPFTKSI